MLKLHIKHRVKIIRLHFLDIKLCFIIPYCKDKALNLSIIYIKIIINKDSSSLTFNKKTSFIILYHLINCSNCFEISMLIIDNNIRNKNLYAKNNF